MKQHQHCNVSQFEDRPKHFLLSSKRIADSVWRDRLVSVSRRVSSGSRFLLRSSFSRGLQTLCPIYSSMAYPQELALHSLKIKTGFLGSHLRLKENDSLSEVMNGGV